jgi:hypothetical protein
MARKKFDDLVCDLGNGQVALRHKRNAAFLSNADPNAELDLGGTSLWAIRLCRILFWLGLLALIGVLVTSFHIWMWDGSPLTGTVDADVLRFEKNSAQQYANSTDRKWREPDGTVKVIYLDFMPGSSKIEKTVERMDWFMVCILPILPLGFVLGGYLYRKELQRMAQIEETATHVLNGQVTNRIKSKGTVIIQYKTVSPNSQKEIFGGVQLGKLEPALANMQVGADVAVIFASGKQHTLL